MNKVNPVELSPEGYTRWERIGWLRTLVGAFRESYDPEQDDDPTATAEMLRECDALADELESQLA